MTSDEFVNALKLCCRDSAVKDCVANFDNPPGRKPGPELLRISAWFKELSQSDREFVVKAMQDAADATLFGVLCVIDGVRTIENGEEKSEFELYARRGSEKSQLSPSDSFLHDLLKAEP